MVVNYPQIIENNISCKFAVHSRSFAFQKVFPIIPVYSWQFLTVKKVFPIIPVHSWQFLTTKKVFPIIPVYSWQFLTTKNIFLIAVQLLIIAVPPKTFMQRISAACPCDTVPIIPVACPLSMKKIFLFSHVIKQKALSLRKNRNDDGNIKHFIQDANLYLGRTLRCDR